MSVLLRSEVNLPPKKSHPKTRWLRILAKRDAQHQDYQDQVEQVTPDRPSGDGFHHAAGSGMDNATEIQHAADQQYNRNDFCGDPCSTSGDVHDAQSQRRNHAAQHTPVDCSLLNYRVAILHDNRRTNCNGDRSVHEHFRATCRRDEKGAGGDGDFVTPEEAGRLFAEFDETRHST